MKFERIEFMCNHLTIGKVDRKLRGGMGRARILDVENHVELTAESPQLVVCVKGACSLDVLDGDLVEKLSLLPRDGIIVPVNSVYKIRPSGTDKVTILTFDIDVVFFLSLLDMDKIDVNHCEMAGRGELFVLDSVLIESISLILSAYLSCENGASLVDVQEQDFHRVLLFSLGVNYISKVLDLTRAHPAIRHSIRYIQQNFQKQIGPADLAEVSGVGQSTLFSLYRQELKTTPQRVIRQTRLDAAQRMLLEETVMVSQVGYAVGYISHCQFTRDFNAKFGCSPRMWVKHNLFGT